MSRVACLLAGGPTTNDDELNLNIVYCVLGVFQTFTQNSIVHHPTSMLHGMESHLFEHPNGTKAYTNRKSNVHVNELLKITFTKRCTTFVAAIGFKSCIDDRGDHDNVKNRTIPSAHDHEYRTQ